MANQFTTDNHRSGGFKFKRVNTGESNTNAKRIYENVKCDMCHEPALFVMISYRNIDLKEAKAKVGAKRYDAGKRLYLCHTHIKEMAEILTYLSQL